MKEFMKENIAIIAAVVLPLALVVIFLGATAITNITVDDPQYDFLLATNYRNSDNDSVRFDVVDNKLVATYRYPRKNEHNYYIYNNTPQLWRVHVDTMAVEEISLPLPDKGADDETKPNIELKIPHIHNMELSTMQPGPDGYMFDYSDHYYRGNLMTEVFSYDRGRYSYYGVLEKDGRSIPVKALGKKSYRYNTHFIGWITEDNSQ